MLYNNREKTPIDILIESSKKNIYINISRNVYKSPSYNIDIEGIDNPVSMTDLSREATYTYARFIYNKYRRENVILNNKYSRTKVRSFALCKILSDEMLHEKLDKLFALHKRSERRFGHIPAKKIKGFKRVNPVAMRPFEKQW